MDGCGLEALELAEGRERRVAVVEMGDEAEIELAVAGMVAEAAAGGGVIEREAEIVIDAARLVQVRPGFPRFP